MTTAEMIAAHAAAVAKKPDQLVGLLVADITALCGLATTADPAWLAAHTKGIAGLPPDLEVFKAASDVAELCRLASQPVAPAPEATPATTK